MIKGRVKEALTKEFILDKISEYDIFKRYMPWDFKLNVTCRSPFTEKDESPSFIIGTRYGKITFKAFNTQNKGDCFHFCEQLFNIPYNEALSKIAKDFGLLNGELSTTERIIPIKQIIEPKKPTLIQIKAKKFSDKEKKYLSGYHLEPQDLQFCPDTKVYSVKEWAVNRLKMPLESNEICFAYNLVNERGNWLKVYRPEASKKEKWKTNIPFLEMHGVGNISKGCKVGIITKAIKCGAFLVKFILPNIEVVSAEDWNCLTKENITRLKESCEKLYISFDNDKKGVEASISLTESIGCEYINPPKHLLERNITDWSDWGKNENPYAVIDYFKQKGVIL